MNTWKSILLGLAISAPAMAQLTTTQCTSGATLTADDFQVTELINRTGANTALVRDADLSEPTRLDVQIVKEGDSLYSNVYFTERLGNVKMFDGKTKTMKLMGKISTLGKSDNGLMGLALHPDYVKNRWIYFWYSPTQLIGQNRQLRLVRITVKSDNTLDMTTEKILINIRASKTDTWHSGGPMTFDAYGDLWVAVGNNSLDLDPGACDAGNSVLSPTDSTNSSEWGSSNTASLRGGFFRIHPDSTEKGYSIPRGNFGEFWADYWDKQGDSALAKEYRDPLKVLPEVYVKGERSNYSIAVHPTKRWLAWGTVNYAGSNDEFNITPTPIFSGFPYFHANNVKTCNHSNSATAPVNNSPLNSGVKKLPPAKAPIISNLMNVAIGGPIYVFNSSLDSKFKFPPHFHNKWLVGNEANANMYAITFDTNSFALVNQTRVDNGVFTKFKHRNYIQSMFGADGALYVLNYDAENYSTTPRNPGIMKVIYKGACVVPLTTGISAAPKAEAYQKIWLSQTSLTVGEIGVHAFSLYDLSGHKVYQAEGREGAVYAFDRLLGTRLNPGVYLVRVTTAQGVFMRQASLL